MKSVIETRLSEPASSPQGQKAKLPEQSGRQAAMVFIMAAVVIDMISIGLIIPVLPPLVGTFTQSHSEHTLAQLAVTVAFGLANFIASPILGGLSDRYGRRRVLLLGFTGLALSFFVTAMATALWMLLVVRVFSGAMNANMAVANAYVADITAPEERAKRFGMLGAAFGVGFVLGPVMGGVLGQIDLHLPFFVAGTLAVINGLYGYFVLPESLPPERRRAFDWKQANPLASLSRLKHLEGVGSLVYVLALSGLAQFILHTSWVLYTGHKFGWSPRDNGLSLFLVGVMSVLVQGFLLRHILKRVPVPRLAVVGLASAVAANLLWALAGEGWMMFAGILVGALGYAAGPALQSQISNASDPKSQGETMGTLSSLNSLMTLVAPLLGLGLMYAVSDAPASDWRSGAPFFLCAALQLASLVVAWRHFARHQSAPVGQVGAP